MVIDFKENIDLLEKLIFNFVLTEDDNDVIIKPKNYDSLDKHEVIPLIKAHYFNDNDLQRVYRAAKKFFMDYGKIPTRNELRDCANLANVNLSDSQFAKLFEIDLRSYNYDFLYKYTKAFVFYRNLNESVIDVLSFLKTTTVDPDNVEMITNEVREKFNSKLNVCLTNAESGLNFFNVVDHVQLSKVGNPTGFPFFDKTLGGGWNPKTLVVFQGRPKVGKSMVLSNIGGRAFMSGCNVGIATLELSDRKYMKRLGSMILDIPFKDYDSMLDNSQVSEVSIKMSKLKATIPTLGELQVKEFPTGAATAIDIENYFLKVQQNTGKKFTVIIVDYINLMRPLREQGNIYEKVKVISEELRAVAIRNEWCVITATQIKRDAVDGNDLGMSDIAESFGLVHTVDSLFGLIRGPMEKRMKIKLIANRDGGYTESFKMYRMSYEYSKLTEETDPASQFYSDDDDTQSLENQMRNQYNNVSTQPHYEPRRPEPAFTPALSSRQLIPIEEAIARFEVRNNPISEPIVEPKPKSLTHDYDDILNSIG
jgi:replicative DNA helicase